MSVPTDDAAKTPARRPPREALERWLAEADALLATEGPVGVTAAAVPAG